MIEINLLPMEHRPIDRTPAPRLATLLVGTFLASLLVVTGGYFWYVLKPRLKNTHDRLAADQQRLQKDADKMAEIEKKIQEYRSRQETVVTLVEERVKWTRLLDSLADKCTEDPKVWLSQLDYQAAQQVGFVVGGSEKGDGIELTGYALGEDGTQMFRNAALFIGRLRDHEPFSENFVTGGIRFRGLRVVELKSSGGTEKIAPDAPAVAGEFRVKAELHPPGKKPDKKPEKKPEAGATPGTGTGTTPAPGTPPGTGEPSPPETAPEADTPPAAGGDAATPAPEVAE